MRRWGWLAIIGVMLATGLYAQDVAENTSSANDYRTGLLSELDAHVALAEAERTTATLQLSAGDAKAREAARIVAEWRKEREAVLERIAAIDGRLAMMEKAREILGE